MAEKLGRQMSVLGRLAEPDDVAAMVVFLASEEAQYLTASMYMVDGGQVSGGPTLSLPPGQSLLVGSLPYIRSGILAPGGS